MCGFTGVLSRRQHADLLPDPDMRSILSTMTATLSRRGPDAKGEVVSGPVGLGHCRLSVIDLTETGAQPMWAADRRLLVSYNGECYNFTELKVELESRGHRFRGRSDTEVILHTYLEWGLRGLTRLEGIFAFALWDAEQHRLILMRDRLGVKPLYYGESATGLAFGSEIKAVLAAGGVDTGLDEQAFREYLWYGNSFDDRTFYKGVRSLLPGHWLIADPAGTRVEPWWRVEDWVNPENAVGSFQEVSLRLRSELDRAVDRQLVADVPIAVFLSGGLDSSSIAAAAARGNRAVTSFTASFDYEKGVNEVAKAAGVARLLGLEHRELQISGTDLPAILDKLATAHDEPFGDAANIPLYLMCREIQGDCKVVLQGDGGDELFGGYRRYSLLRNRHLWRLWPKLSRPMLRRLADVGRRINRIADALSQDDEAMRMALLLTVETTDFPPEDMLRTERYRELCATTDPFLAYRRADERFRACEPVQRMLLTDLTVELPSTFLNKVDRATMAVGVEARVPLLDDRFVQFSLGVPADWKVTRTRKKHLLRESQRGRLPNDVLDAPKTGFGVPYEHWLRTSLYDYTRSVILDPAFLGSFSLNGDKLEGALRDHRDRKQDRGFLLWKMLQLGIWHDARRITR